MIELTPNEKMLLQVRKHWMVIAQDIVVLGSIILAPFIFYLVSAILDLPSLIDIQGNATLLEIFFGSLWIVIFWTMMFIAWTDYYLDILVITSERIFDIEQKGLFNRDSSTFRLDRIQDVTVEVKGILPTLFKFGHIHIQTAGEGRVFIAKYIPKPYKVKELIMHEHDKAMEKLQGIHEFPSETPDA